MPAGDQTGPSGLGPLTGRGLGPCGRGYGFGRGLGRGFRRGFGFQRMPYVEPTKNEEKAYLEAELKAAEEDIEAIKKKLQELK